MDIGIGDGAEQSHYTRNPFWKVITKKSKVKMCKDCLRVQVFGKAKYCANCAKTRQRARNRKRG